MFLRVAALSLALFTSDLLALNLFVNYSKKAESALLANDLEAAELAINKIDPQLAPEKWTSYRETLRLFKQYRAFQNSLEQFRASNSTNYIARLYDVKAEYSTYIKTFERIVKRFKYSKKLTQHLNMQAEEASNQMDEIISTHNSNLENKLAERLKEQEKIKAEEEQKWIAKQAERDERRKQELAAENQRELQRQAKAKKAEEARIKLEQDRQKAVSDEIQRLDKLAKAAGFLGYENLNVLELIYNAQQKGDLAKHLNMVVGCHKYTQIHCEEGYSRLRAIQVTDEGVIYGYNEYAGDENIKILVYSPKIPGKLYLEGQVFENSLHTFTGMFTYTSVIGAKKSIPILNSVHLE